MAWCCWDVEQDIGAQGAKKLLQQNFDARFSRCCSVSVINYFSDSPDPLNHVRSCVFSRMFKSWWSCLMMLMNSSCWDIWAMFNDVWQGNIWRKCLNFRFWMLVCKDLTDRQFTGHPCFANSGAQHRQTLFTCLVLTDLPVWVLVQPPEQLLRLHLVVGGPLAHNLVHGAQRSAQANISAKFLSLQIIVKNGPKFEYLGSWQEIT